LTTENISSGRRMSPDTGVGDGGGGAEWASKEIGVGGCFLVGDWAVTGGSDTSTIGTSAVGEEMSVLLEEASAGPSFICVDDCSLSSSCSSSATAFPSAMDDDARSEEIG